MTEYCSKCGEPLKEEALFCANCGEKVPKKQEISFNKYIILIIILIIVFAIVGSAFFSFQSNPNC